MEVKKNFKEIVSRNKDLDGKVKKIEEEEWGQFLKRIKNHNVTLFGVLADVLTKEIQGEKLNLGVAFAFYKKKIEQHIFRAIIEKEAKGFFGKKLELVCHLKEGNLQEIKSEEKSMLSSVKEIFEIN